VHNSQGKKIFHQPQSIQTEKEKSHFHFLNQISNQKQKKSLSFLLTQIISTEKQKNEKRK
jgi:hypothetical protein